MPSVTVNTHVQRTKNITAGSTTVVRAGGAVNLMQSVHKTHAFKFWYSFGKFTNKKMKFWKVDKEELLKQLEREIERFDIIECPVFNIDKAKAMIASFPETIHIDGDKYVLLEDSKTGKVLGISHWDDPDDYLNMNDYEVKWQD